MKLNLTKDAQDWLSDLKEPKRYRQVVNKIFSLLTDPNPNDSIQLTGYDARRTSAGEYRIIYRYNEAENVLYIILVEKRNDDEVYRLLKR